MRKLILNLHLYAGLTAGLLIVIFGLTGSIMAFEPELEHLLHPHLMYVTPGPSRLSLAEVTAAVEKAFPGERIFAYGIARSPDLSDQVALRRGVVHVDEYTGRVLGVRPNGMDFLAYVHQFHLRLLIRNKSDSGKKIMSWAGAALLVLMISGVYLWWPLKRLRIDWKAASWRAWFDLHNVVGIYSFVFLLLLCITGLVIGFSQETVPLLYRMTGSQPSPPPNLKISPPPGARPITPDQVVEIAREALPGAQPFQVDVPPPDRPYLVRSSYPEDLTPGGRSIIVVDPYSGKVLYAESSRTAPGGTRLVNLNRAIHTGDIFGMPSKIVMSLASLAAALQFISGVAMWWKRRKRTPSSQDS